MKEKIVSVIVPVYNTQKYIRECIDSVLAQPIELELILVDDSSSDDSLLIMEEYEKIDERVKVIRHEKNQGQSISRNDGLALATGKYIYFLDSDDYIVENIFNEVISFMEENQLEGVLLDTITNEEISHQGFKEYKTSLRGNYSNVRDGHSLLIELMTHKELIVSQPRYVWKREFLKKVNILFEKEIMYEDNLFLMEVLLKNPKIQYFSKVIFIRRIREGSLMTSPPSLHNLYSHYLVLQRHVALLEDDLITKMRDIVEIMIRLYKELVDSFLNELYEKEGETQLLEKVKQLEYRYKEKLFSYIYYWIIEKNKSYFDAELWNKLSKRKQIIIYGAGVYAQKLIEEVREQAIEIIAVAVTKLEKKEIYVYGYKVKELKEIMACQDIVVVIAASKFAKEMEQYARELGFSEIILCQKKDVWKK